MAIIVIVAFGAALMTATLRIADSARTKRPIVVNVPVYRPES
jgi:hypothetical protein